MRGGKSNIQRIKDSLDITWDSDSTAPPPPPNPKTEGMQEEYVIEMICYTDHYTNICDSVPTFGLLNLVHLHARERQNVEMLKYIECKIAKMYPQVTLTHNNTNVVPQILPANAS